MKLIFDEDFNQTSINDKFWNIEHAGHGFGNQELQFYTPRPNNVYIKDSILHIVAQKEDYEHRNYTSAKLTTAKKFNFTYGKIIIRMKLPKGKGTWPAVWMLGKSIHEGIGWPACGEIDLMEHVGKEPDDLHFSLHSKNFNHLAGNNYHEFKHIKGLTDDFHIYEINWTKEGFTYFVDGVLVFETYRNEKRGLEEWPFDEPHFLILNLAIGGFWGGEIDDSIFPTELLIDYIKIYQSDKDK